MKEAASAWGKYKPLWDKSHSLAKSVVHWFRKTNNQTNPKRSHSQAKTIQHQYTVQYTTCISNHSMKEKVWDLVTRWSYKSCVAFCFFLHFSSTSTFLERRSSKMVKEGLVVWSYFRIIFLKKRDERWWHLTISCPQSCWYLHFYFWHNCRVCLTAGYETNTHTHTHLYFYTYEDV